MRRVTLALVSLLMLSTNSVVSASDTGDERARIKRVAVPVANFEQALVFFRDVIGFTVESEGMLDTSDEPYLAKVFDLGSAKEVRQALLSTATEKRGLFVMEIPGMKPLGDEVPRSAMMVIETSDLDALKHRAEEAGFRTDDYRAERSASGMVFKEMSLIGPSGHAFLVYQLGKV